MLDGLFGETRRNFLVISNSNFITWEVIPLYFDGAEVRCRGNLYPQLFSSGCTCRCAILQFYSPRFRWLPSSPTQESPKRKIYLYRARSHWLYIHLRLVLTLDYVCVSSIHKLRPGYNEKLDEDDPERYIPGLPVISFRLTDEFKVQYPHVKQAAVSTLLRVKGWILPNYPLPPTEEKTEILRVVVRESFSSSLLPQ